MKKKMPALEDVFKAKKRIDEMIWETPLWESPAITKDFGANSVFLKLECLQNTGAFKVRGAANKILSLNEEEKKRGVITFSTGNHGKAVSYVAGKSGIKAVVCLSENVPKYRAKKIEALGAHVEVYGSCQDEAEQRYYELLKKEGYIPVVPFDDPAIIAGQGTIALEMLYRQPDLDVILVPLSGGGLLSGIALAAKAINPSIKIVGVSISQSPAMLESVKAGKPVLVEEKDTHADSLLGGIGVRNYYTLPLIQEYVDEHIVIDEEEIEKGMIYAFTEHSLVIEGASAVGIAAILSKKIDVTGKNVGLVISGSSVEPERYRKILSKYI